MNVQPILIIVTVMLNAKTILDHLLVHANLDFLALEQVAKVHYVANLGSTELASIFNPLHRHWFHEFPLVHNDM